RVVQGTVNNPVVVTSLKDDSYGGDTNSDGNTTSPAPGDWNGVYFGPMSSGNSLNSTVVDYSGETYRISHWDPATDAGGSTYYQTWSSLYLDGASASINNSVIGNGNGVG